jgi:hypothetical protein
VQFVCGVGVAHLCLFSTGGYVFVGTSDGQLLLYEANQVNTGEGESFAAKLLQRKQLAHGKKVSSTVEDERSSFCSLNFFFFFFFFFSPFTFSL